jgi:hypothetical protein
VARNGFWIPSRGHFANCLLTDCGTLLPDCRAQSCIETRCRFLLHPGQDVAVPVNSYRHAAVPQSLADAFLLAVQQIQRISGSHIQGYPTRYVTLYQNGYVFSGKGWRTLASEETHWHAECEFWLYGGGVKAKFQCYIAIKYVGDPKGAGRYYLNGSVAPYYWECYLDND